MKLDLFAGHEVKDCPQGVRVSLELGAGKLLKHRPRGAPGSSFPGAAAVAGLGSQRRWRGRRRARRSHRRASHRCVAWSRRRLQSLAPGVRGWGRRASQGNRGLFFGDCRGRGPVRPRPGRPRARCAGPRGGDRWRRCARAGAPRLGGLHPRRADSRGADALAILGYRRLRQIPRSSPGGLCCPDPPPMGRGMPEGRPVASRHRHYTMRAGVHRPGRPACSVELLPPAGPTGAMP